MFIYSLRKNGHFLNSHSITLDNHTRRAPAVALCALEPVNHVLSEHKFHLLVVGIFPIGDCSPCAPVAVVDLNLTCTRGVELHH